MKAAEGAVRSPLDKPLKELTEEDILQLTREDCRRYLKEKGMRRPSWNKSQAIQQVLSLKALFDSWPGKTGSFSRKSSPKPLPGCSGGLCPPDRRREDPENVSEGSTSGSGEGSAPHDLEIPATKPDAPLVREPDLYSSKTEDRVEERPSTTGDVRSRQSIREPAGDLPTSSDAGEKVAQLTIFYGGKVHVYNDIATEKARDIIVLAGCSNFMPQITEPRPPPVPATGGSCRNLPSSPSSYPTEGPKTRKVSVQRFLEKRKDRARLKGVCGRPKSSSSPMELFLDQHQHHGSLPVSTLGTTVMELGGNMDPEPWTTRTLPMPPPTPGRTG